MSVTKESILKAILLKEFDRMRPDVSTFEDDPMQFILRKYEGLNKTLTYLMTPSFQDYVTGIYIVAPKPTTFKIVLHNGQFFFLQFTGKTYQATVAGKNYYLMNIGEKERCMLAIARLLRYGNPLKTKGPEGAEQGTREGGEEGGGGEEVPEATPEEGGGEEETIAESRILEEILKKKLSEDEDFDEDDTKKYERIVAANINNQISEIKKSLPEEEKSITIKIKGIPYPDIEKAVIVEGTINKSDINLLDSKGTPIIFISHKDEGGPKRFARWGSFQYLYGKNTEVNNFKKNIYAFVSQNINKKDGENIDYANIENGNLVFYKKAAFSQKISEDDLKKKLVFGKDFGSKEKFGLNNVQLVVQGNLVLKKLGEEKGVYEFDVEKSENIWFSGELPSGEYEPVLHVHYRAKSKRTQHNELGIKNCETMARPISAISNVEKVRSLWEPNQVLDPDIEIPKYKVEIDKKDSVLKNKEGDISAASKDWIDKNKEYKKYFNVDEKNPLTYPGKQGIFYAVKPNADIKLVRQAD